jgi:hypothetical protein
VRLLFGTMALLAYADAGGGAATPGCPNTTAATCDLQHIVTWGWPRVIGFEAALDLEEHMVTAPQTEADDRLWRWQAGFEDLLCRRGGSVCAGRLAAGADVAARAAVRSGARELVDDR